MAIHNVSDWWQEFILLKNSYISTAVLILNLLICLDALNIAKVFKDNMDTTVDPCDNFYKFACGKFINDTIVPKSSARVNLFTVTEMDINKNLKKALESKVEESEPQSLERLQDYYNVCMNSSQIEQNSIKDLRSIFKQLGGWPVVLGNLWDESAFDWENVNLRISTMGYPASSIINLEVIVNQSNTNEYTIYIDQPEFVIEQEQLITGLSHPAIKAYFNYMVEFAVLLGADFRKAKRELSESLQFEINLARISLSHDEQIITEFIFSAMTIQELQNISGGIKWLEYINSITSVRPRLRDTYTLYAGPNIFIQNIGRLLALTPKRVIANYLLWKVAYYSASKMNERVKSQMNKFNSFVFDTEYAPERWQICVNEVKTLMGVAVSSLYVRRFFDKDLKVEATTLLNSIREAYIQIVQKLDWMDEETKQVALDKLRAMVDFVAYPDELLDNEKLDELYKDVTVDFSSFLKTHLHMKRRIVSSSFANLQMPISKYNWIAHSYASSVNTFYRLSENSIIIPAGILQGMFFSKKRAKFLNYGVLGVLIGHEMTHALDNEGVNFDKNGNLATWWHPTTRKNYEKRVKDIIEQYNAITVKEVGLKLNGVLTAGENIADQGGYKQAYLAYNNWLKVNGLEPGLPDLTFTINQLFWISTANLWCSKSTLHDLRSQVCLDTHSPNEFRVNIPLSNNQEFAKDFNCSLGSMMNPVKKYSVW